MKINLTPKFKRLQPALKIIRLLNQKGFEAYLVGGSVRDLLLNRDSDNLDIATNAVPDEVEAILTKAKISVKPFGKKFGTILALVGKMVVEITTYREEGRYSDRRHPDKVSFIKDYIRDAKRRDFTINAMYLDCKSGEVLDPLNGLKDLELKLIRFVGKPQHRIDEDALRMLRAVRFATVMNFSAEGGPASGWKLEKNSFASIKTRAKYIQGVSGERIKAEFDKILLSKNRKAGIRLLEELGILRFLIPGSEKAKLIGHDSSRYHLEGNVFEHTLLALDHSDDINVLYAMLFHDLGKVSTQNRHKNKYGEMVFGYHGHQKVSAEMFNRFAERLKFPRQQQKLVEWLILRHDDRLQFRQAKLANQLTYVSQPSFSLLLEAWLADSMANIRVLSNGKTGPASSEAYDIGKKLLTKLNRLRPLIARFASGDKIISVTNLKAGPKIKNIQDQIKEKIFLGEIKTESDLDIFLKKFHKNT